jgi:hypothetical protein
VLSGLVLLTYSMIESRVAYVAMQHFVVNQLQHVTLRIKLTKSLI